MSEEQMQESKLPETLDMLQGRPRRQSRRGLALLLALLGIVLLASVGVFIAWQALSSGLQSTGTGAANPLKGNNNGGSAVPPGWNDPATYWNPIRTTVAQGLNLSVAQVTAKLQAAAQSTFTPTSSNKGSAPEPGAAMTALAAQQELSIEQLRALELSALQKGCDAMVAQGKLSQADASQRVQTFNGWDQGTLNWYIMHAFTGQ